MPTVKRTDLTQFMLSLLAKAGLAPDKAQLIIDHLLYAEMAGKKSHGVFRLVGVLDRLKTGKNLGKADPVLILDLPSLGLIDAGDHIGLIAGHAATECAIKKAKESGIAFIGARNFGGTTGCAGYYAKMLADADLAGMITMNSYALVCPPNSYDRVLGTNPVAFAIPGDTQDILVDVSIATMPYGKMAMLQREGKAAPQGTILTKHGAPSIDPKDADDGALTPMSGNKGFALGVALELLAGPLIGAKAGNSVKGSDGFMVMAIDPARFGDIATFKSQIQTFVDEVHGTSRLNAEIENVLPGEISTRTYENNLKKDTLDINDKVYEELEAFA